MSTIGEPDGVSSYLNIVECKVCKEKFYKMVTSSSYLNIVECKENYRGSEGDSLSVVI